MLVKYDSSSGTRGTQTHKVYPEGRLQQNGEKQSWRSTKTLGENGDMDLSACKGCDTLRMLLWYSVFPSQPYPSTAYLVSKVQVRCISSGPTASKGSGSETGPERGIKSDNLYLGSTGLSLALSSAIRNVELTSAGLVSSIYHDFQFDAPRINSYCHRRE